ncbi:hypothetical protein Q8A64_12500 [Oxalobacteraceae bacterium R-40]|uniref:Uncharacterized protein n=1 Tax=Keguizhuia sedimenti TaxID=3064264 RepID=A0ABU1BS47_9BURK|nr:hypothetical protein [Oxalobacteraceae bacterium R-40]
MKMLECDIAHDNGCLLESDIIDLVGSVPATQYSLESDCKILERGDFHLAIADLDLPNQAALHQLIVRGEQPSHADVANQPIKKLHSLEGNAARYTFQTL